MGVTGTQRTLKQTRDKFFLGLSLEGQIGASDMEKGHLRQKLLGVKVL